MLMLHKLFLLHYTFSIAPIIASVCDEATPDELHETYDTCVNLIDNFNSCWEGQQNILCSGYKHTTIAERKCLDILQPQIEQCKIREISNYLTRLGTMMRSTDEILCAITFSPVFNPQCTEFARSSTLLQAKFMLDGFDTVEGCGYRAIYSILNEYYSNEYELCRNDMKMFRQKWYDLPPCVRFKDTRDEYLSKTGNEIETMCFQIQSDVDDCFRKLLQCDPEQLDSWQCFNDVLNPLPLCTDPLMQINIRHRAETMKSALDFLCKSCPDLIRDDCFQDFEKLTLYTASAAKEFHSSEFCVFRKQYMDVIAFSSPPKCRRVMKEFSNYMYEVATCVNVTEMNILHQLHDPAIGFENSAQSLPLTLIYIAGLIIIEIVRAFF